MYLICVVRCLPVVQLQSIYFQNTIEYKNVHHCGFYYQPITHSKLTYPSIFIETARPTLNYYVWDCGKHRKAICYSKGPFSIDVHVAARIQNIHFHLCQYLLLKGFDVESIQQMCQEALYLLRNVMFTYICTVAIISCMVNKAWQTQYNEVGSPHTLTENVFLLFVLMCIFITILIAYSPFDCYTTGCNSKVSIFHGLL